MAAGCWKTKTSAFYPAAKVQLLAVVVELREQEVGGRNAVCGALQEMMAQALEFRKTLETVASVYLVIVATWIFSMFEDAGRRQAAPNCFPPPSVKSHATACF